MADDFLNKERIQFRNWELCQTDEERALEYLKPDCSAEERTNFHRKLPALRTGWVAEWVVQNEEQIRLFAGQLQNAKSLTGEALRKSFDDAWGGKKPPEEKLAAEVQDTVSTHFASGLMNPA